MAPFTPFFTEQMYQNLRRCLPEGQAPESVHFCDFPAVQQPWKGDDHIQRSVERMQTVIELSRTIRCACTAPVLLLSESQMLDVSLLTNR